MADQAPDFAFYVSSVKGRLVSWPGDPHRYIGAALRSPDEVKAGITEPQFFEDQVVAVPRADYLKHVRHWDRLFKHGDLVKREQKDFDTYQKSLEAVDRARVAELAKPAKVEKPTAPGGA